MSEPSAKISEQTAKDRKELLENLHRDVIHMLHTAAPEALKALRKQTDTRIVVKEDESGAVYRSTSYLKLGDHKISKIELNDLRDLLLEHLMPVDFHERVSPVRFPSGEHGLKLMFSSYVHHKESPMSTEESPAPSESEKPAEAPVAPTEPEPSAPAVSDPVPADPPAEAPPASDPVVEPAPEPAPPPEPTPSPDAPAEPPKADEPTPA